MRRARQAELRRQRLPDDTPTVFIRSAERAKTTDDRPRGDPRSKVNYGKR